MRRWHLQPLAEHTSSLQGGLSDAVPHPRNGSHVAEVAPHPRYGSAQEELTESHVYSVDDLEMETKNKRQRRPLQPFRFKLASCLVAVRVNHTFMLSWIRVLTGDLAFCAIN